MMLPGIRCECGNVRGSIEPGATFNHCMCYCRDCRAFVRHLGKADSTLDRQGGSRIIQTQPRRLHFSQGREHLACLRLSDKGILRWYASCCHTPLGNTHWKSSISFIGLIHNCMDLTSISLEEAFGPVNTVVHVGSALGEPKPEARGLVGALVRLLGWIIVARLSGSYRKNELFEPSSGLPVVPPSVLTTEERKAAYADPAPGEPS